MRYPSPRWFLLLAPLLWVGLMERPPGVLAADPAFPPISQSVQKLYDKNVQTRLDGGQALGNWGTPAKTAIPAVVEMLNQKDQRLQSQAARTLAQIGPASVPQLKAALKDQRTSVRYWATDALRRMGADGKEAVPELFEAAKDHQVYVRTGAVKALLAIDPESKELSDLLQNMARKEPHSSLRLLAQLWSAQIRAQADKQALINPFFTSCPALTPAQQARLNEEVMAMIISETTHGSAHLVPTNYFYSTNALVRQGGQEIIPALVWGVNKGIVLRASCPFGLLVSRLRTLVAECTEPRLLDYVVLHLGEDIPPTLANVQQFLGMALPIKAACVQRKAELEYLAGVAERHKELVANMLDQGDKEIKAEFGNKDAGVRFAALCIASHRRLHCEGELIALLADSEPRIVQTARQSLVRLARGTDFGPAPKADPASCRAAERWWRYWWQYQDANPQKIEPPEDNRQFTLVASRRLPSQADYLGSALVKAVPARRAELLKKLQMGKGGEYTDALASAIHRLKGNARKQAREALAERLTRMTARTLRDDLTDEDSEIRRAAALAAARKEDHELIPYLIPLLGDEEGEVLRAARAALRSLTGENFGPPEEADSQGKIEAIKKWRAWWAGQEER